MIKDSLREFHLRELIQEAIDAWPQLALDPSFANESDLYINGADMIEWFSRWREQAIAVLKETNKMNRENLYAKIRALLAKTEDNGCTREEALSALVKAYTWMDAYEVSEYDLALDANQRAARKIYKEISELYNNGGRYP